MDRRKFLCAGAAFCALAVAMPSDRVTATPFKSNGDITDVLARSSPGDTVRVETGIWTVSRSIRVAAKTLFDGGILLPAPGCVITFEQDIETPVDRQLFDLRNVTWAKGIRRSSALKRSSHQWHTVGGVRLPNLAKASWFGAVEKSGFDNTLVLQAMLDSEARVAVLDGFYEHTANWLAKDQTLRGEAGFEDDRRVGLKTLVHQQSFASLLENRNPRSPADEAFRGLSTRPNAGDVVFADFEYDGSADQHFDHRDVYSSYLSETGGRPAGKNAFRRFLLRQGGINVGSFDDDQGYRPPSSTLIERVYIHDTVRSCIIANDAPQVTIRDCNLANSDTDHLIYADRNPDILIEGTTFSGYSHAGMIVLSCGTIRDCSVTNLTPNPMTGLDTQWVVWLRSDIDYPSTIEGLSIIGDLSALDKSGGLSEVILFTGQRSAYLGDIEVRHTGGNGANIALFGNRRASSRIAIYTLDASAMPEGATLWSTTKRVRDLSIENVRWGYADGEVEAPALLNFGALENASFDNLQLTNGHLDTLVSVSRGSRDIGIGDIDGQERVGRLIVRGLGRSG
ncbi:right-handed parallel beta-helix repeat-containing protein [Qipengyuania aquimaris]|uniref:right-handed parallel beta-helix repeat-containing protein n=1 Tax=Qipengyuania aquimaris TaxID=255984 RepID=UPI001FD0F970|nr:right-handed parallel beta-helix repeat-containing protein [Qipengyuania aquimaris]UOR14985.1 right-handed parallel beta-helix repeat-containing protein [Qipengyuania aquimaris]